MKKLLFGLYLFSYAALGIIAIGGLSIGTISLVLNRDVIFNPHTYTKRYVPIDSLAYSHSKGSQKYFIEAFSKEVDNGKTPIEIVNIDTDFFYKYIEKENGQDYIYIWYKPAQRYAYLAKKEEKIFPVNEYVRDYRNILIAFIAFLLLNRSLYRYLKNFN